jgi:hypothetical protein
MQLLLPLWFYELFGRRLQKIAIIGKTFLQLMKATSHLAIEQRVLLLPFLINFRVFVLLMEAVTEKLIELSRLCALAEQNIVLILTR